MNAIAKVDHESIDQVPFTTRLKLITDEAAKQVAKAVDQLLKQAELNIKAFEEAAQAALGVEYVDAIPALHPQYGVCVRVTYGEKATSPALEHLWIPAPENFLGR